MPNPSFSEATRIARRAVSTAVGAGLLLSMVGDRGPTAHAIPQSEASRNGHTLIVDKSPATLLGVDYKGSVLATSAAQAQQTEACGPKFDYKGWSADIHGISQRVEYPIRGNVVSNNKELGMFMTRLTQTADMVYMPQSEVPKHQYVDQFGKNQWAYLLPVGRYTLIEGTTDINKPPELPYRTEPVFFRVPQFHALEVVGKEAIGIQAFATACGNLNINVPQIDFPQTQDFQDNRFLFISASDASRGYFDGPVLSVEGAIHKHTLVGMVEAPHYDGLVEERWVERQNEMSGGKGQIDLFAIRLDNFALMHARQHVGERPASGRRNLDDTQLFNQVLFRNFSTIYEPVPVDPKPTPRPPQG